METYKKEMKINGFNYKTMFASVNFSNDGVTPLCIYEDEIERINEDDEVCIIERIYQDGKLHSTNIIERNIDPERYELV